MEMRLRVDPVACDGFGHCAELAPELIALDEWGYPILSPAPIPKGHQKIAEMAVNQCPRRALLLERLETSIRHRPTQARI
jgi:ferredoxin